MRATHPQNHLSLQRQYSVLKLVQHPFTLSLFRGGPVHFAAQLSYCSHLSWGRNGICQQIHSWFEFSTFTCNDPTALVFDCDPEMTLFRLILYAQALILALHVCCHSKQQAARVFIRSTACKNSHILCEFWKEDSYKFIRVSHCMQAQTQVKRALAAELVPIERTTIVNQSQTPLSLAACC